MFRLIPVVLAASCAIAAEPSPRERLVEAWSLYKNNRCAEAVAIADKLLDVVAVAPDAHKLSGICLAQLGRGPEAASRFLKAVEIAPEDAMAWFYLGFARLRMFRHSEAVAPLRRAIELNPGHAEAYYNLGIALEQSQQVAEAEKLYRRMVDIMGEIAGEAGRPQLFLGRMLVHNGRHAEAVAPLEVAAQRMPKSADALKFLGRAYRHVGRDEEALRVLEAALAINADDREVKYLLMRAYVALGREELAREQAKSIEALDSKRGRRD